MRKINERLLHAYVLAQNKSDAVDVEGYKTHVLNGKRDVRIWWLIIIIIPIMLTLLCISTTDARDGIFLAPVISVGILIIAINTYASIINNPFRRWLKTFKEFEKLFEFLPGPSNGSWIYVSDVMGTGNFGGTYEFLSNVVDAELRRQAFSVVSLEKYGDLDRKYQHAVAREKLSEMHRVATDLGLTNSKIETYFPKREAQQS